jgi:DNA-directed RNA polymerase subunit L
MVNEKQVKKISNKITPKKTISTLSIEDRLHAFANIIVERILEDKRRGVLQYKVNQNE